MKSLVKEEAAARADAEAEAAVEGGRRDDADNNGISVEVGKLDSPSPAARPEVGRIVAVVDPVNDVLASVLGLPGACPLATGGRTGMCMCMENN
jgi:hypothetical protein